MKCIDDMGIGYMGGDIARIAPEKMLHVGKFHQLEARSSEITNTDLR
jgi:hypothetical protein